MSATDGLRTSRTTLKRLPERGAHDFDTITSILDEAIFCHIGFVADGQPFVVPTTFGRIDRTLYIHGSAASRMLRTLSSGTELCFTATILDGLVYARSAFHNSMNYRSVMVLGTAEPVEGNEKLRGLEAVTEHMTRGRWAQSRPPTDQELKATSVLRLEIEEASAKIRTGGPKDDEDDLALPIWAGYLPLAMRPGQPVSDARASAGVDVPGYVRNYER
jgi:hypothetical protein